MSETRTSWIELALVAAIAGMLLIVALPGLLSGKKPVNEEEAVAALRTLNTIEVSYQNRHPTKGFTCSLDELYQDGLIDAKIAGGTRSGYRLASSGCRSNSPKSSVITDYEWYADPVSSETGTRHFCTDQGGVIRGSDIYSRHDCVTFGSEL